MSECPYQKRSGVPKEKNRIRSNTGEDEMGSLWGKQNSQAKSNFGNILFSGTDQVVFVPPEDEI